jgi:hypothetical protein
MWQGFPSQFRYEWLQFVLDGVTVLVGSCFSEQLSHGHNDEPWRYPPHYRDDVMVEP